MNLHLPWIKLHLSHVNLHPPRLKLHPGRMKADLLRMRLHPTQIKRPARFSRFLVDWFLVSGLLHAVCDLRTSAFNLIQLNPACGLLWRHTRFRRDE